ncbi:acetyltransferase [Lindgomyces ingoldianus]|uniref:Acetyltransferase n=1 Tax=Lindgomyces ingoldianus TaxID=673940 RepID=A0ACB6R257_9PLEO|nr:acetyltransferase [Lindgomyces ingoldianus]KAF2472587.1 acetyltransferase [Lindgomyces ingoldianus]
MDSKEWQRVVGDQRFLISTSRDLLPHEFVQEAFNHPDMYWTKPTSPANMKRLLDNSCTLGLYKGQADVASTKFTPIGMARLITDHVTFAYLTDVYIVKEYRKFGLGRWLIACCKEMVQEMPELRRCVLLTGSEAMQKLYEREMGMEVFGERKGGLVAMGAQKADLVAASAGKDEQPSC